MSYTEPHNKQSDNQSLAGPAYPYLYVTTLLKIALQQSLNYPLSHFFSFFRVKFALLVLGKLSRTVNQARHIFKNSNPFLFDEEIC